MKSDTTEHDKDVQDETDREIIFRAIFDEAPVVTFALDTNGIFTLSEGTGLEQLGVKAGDAVGQSIFDRYRSFPQIIEKVKRALQGEHVAYETFFKGFLFATNLSPVKDESGRVISVIAVSYDITENRKAAETMRKSEFKLRTLFNSANDSIFTMNNRTFIDCNPATLRIFQCTREQIVGQTPYRFSPQMQPDGRSSEESAMEKINAALEGKPQFFDWRHIRYDGTPFDAEVSLNRVDVEDEVTIQAIVRDVSRRKKAEEENRRLALVANTTTNMVIVANGAGEIIWINPAFTKITGYTLEEVAGKKPGSFLRGPDSDDVAAAIMSERIAAGQGFKDIEIVNYTKEGKPYWVSIEVQPIHDKSGKAIQFIAIESDITERKTSQQALQDRNEDLIKINTELDRFVYSASHDLRAPISSLLGLIEVARLEKNTNNLERLLDMQKKSLLRLDRFIKDIVDHSRNTRLKIEPEPVDFKHLVEGILEQLQFMENVGRIRRVIKIEQEGIFQTSATRIDIILNNLISNAIKYADLRKADPFLDVSVKSNSKCAEIRVRDNGEGISPEAMPKIFDMFYRGSGSSSGSGLGLYIVKEAIHKIGGSINVHSDLGDGTEFVVEIPNLIRTH